MAPANFFPPPSSLVSGVALHRLLRPLGELLGHQGSPGVAESVSAHSFSVFLFVAQTRNPSSSPRQITGLLATLTGATTCEMGTRIS